MKLRQCTRLVKLTHIWMRYGLGEILFTIPWLRPLRFLLKCNPLRFSKDYQKTYAERLRLALEALGPLYVKFGQVLSTRRDLLSDELADALALLQDKVTPFDPNESRHMIETALGGKVNELFADFDSQPLASASVAQVHAATLKDGSPVVIKVLRPGIRKVMRQDIELLRTLAKLLSRHWVGAKRFRPLDLVNELERNLYYELDLLREAGNASQLRRNFENSPLLYVPQVYWDYCRRNVMVMERVEGIPVSQVQRLKDLGVNMKLLAERGVELFYTQVFRDCFFHADMHPGNIWVNAEDPANPQFIALDFGIVGSLDDEDKHYLAANFLAFFKRDYRQVAVLHIESGWVSPDSSVVAFESAIRTVCEPIFERPLNEISYGQTLVRLFQIARQFHMTVQPQLMLLQKTLLNIEGMGRELYPELNLWSVARPFLEKWMRTEVGMCNLVRRVAKQWPEINQHLPYVPEWGMLALKNHARPPAKETPPPPVKRRSSLWVILGVVLIIVGLLSWSPVWQWVHQNLRDWHTLLIALLGVMLVLIGRWT